ncbi:MAG: helix-turn-helix domain-containing protein [Deltaproteobacteria bacterium]|nr:helix-turn-helix domain-containing protein [Deltaproteobacteria bacterium]
MIFRKIQDVAEVVGGNISARRKLLRYTQAELAEKLNIGPDSLSRIEKGVVAPRFQRLAAIAAALDCSIADLFRMDKNPLKVNLETVADMLRPLPPDAQEDLLYLMIVAAKTMKKRLHP